MGLEYAYNALIRPILHKYGRLQALILFYYLSRVVYLKYIIKYSITLVEMYLKYSITLVPLYLYNIKKI